MHATRFETVYAIQDFEAENGDEIGFLEGEPILVIQKDDGFDDGWWKGQNMKNEIGLFPKSYIVHNSISSPQPERTKSSAFADDSTLRPSSSSSSTCSNSMLRKSVIRSLFLPKLRFTPPEEWDIEQVQIWLHEMRFTINIVNHFKAQEITGDVLLELTMDSLKELNIPTFGKRFRLYTAINLLKEEYEYQCCNRMSTASSSDGSEEAIESSTTFESIDRFSRHSQISQPSIMSTQNLSRSNHSLPNFTYQKKTLMKASLDMYDPKETGDVGPDTKGWLYKQGCKYKQWNKRWFVLKGINLFYFKSPEDLRMKGIINLRGYRIVPDETIQPGKYSFKAQHFEERTFYFYTDTETSMRQWISPLMKATITRDFSAPVLSSHTIPTVSLGVARRMKPRPPSILLYRRPNRLEFHLPTRLEDDYVQWVNSTVDSANIRDLQELRTGTVLIDLLEGLSCKKVRQSTLGRSSHKLPDLAIAFRFLLSEQIIVGNQCQIKDIQEGDREKMLILLKLIHQWATKLD